MIRWISSLFGLAPDFRLAPTSTKQPASYNRWSETPSNKEDKFDWPEGLQIRKEVRGEEPDNWTHCEWVWHSTGYIRHEGSLYPKLNKAECRHCLGVLKCGACGLLVRPHTKVEHRKAQLASDCPDPKCNATGSFAWLTCEAHTYRFAVEEDGVEYSVWEHRGSHSSHSRPPAGRQPPRSRNASGRAVSHPIAATHLLHQEEDHTPDDIHNVKDNPLLLSLAAAPGETSNRLDRVEHSADEGAAPDKAPAVVSFASATGRVESQSAVEGDLTVWDGHKCVFSSLAG